MTSHHSARRLLRSAAAFALLILPIACGDLAPEALTSTQGPRVSPPLPSIATTCSSCTFVESTGPLYGALADPDSVNNLPLVATAVITGRAGDSVIVKMEADDALVSALPSQEYLLVEGSIADSVQLASLRTSQVVYRFTAGGTITLRYRFNRALITVPAGAIRLTQTTSATLVSFDAPWVTTPEGPQYLASTSPVDNPACGTLLPVNASGTYCEVNVQIVPSAPADAFVGAGARFQSDPGHGQSHAIRIFFSEPVVQVKVTIYDPTFAGNTFTARDSTGAQITTVAYPGNGVPGTLTIQSASATGRIAEIVLNAAAGDYVNYSMQVQFSDESCKATVTSFGQAEASWADDLLDHTQMSIKRRGCALTSMAMGLSAFGVATTPHDLNNQLNADPNGFAVGGGINWDEAAKVASGGSVLFDRFTSTADMKKALCKGRPVVVGVKVIDGTPHHFVLVTEVNPDGSFQIVDPASGSGVSRPLSFYAQPYQIRGAIRSAGGGVSPDRIVSRSASRSLLASGSSADDGPSFVAVSAASARIDLTDANGAHAIADKDIQLMDIPGSTAFADAVDDDDAPFLVESVPNVSVSAPLGASYTAHITPSTNGALSILLQATTPSGVQNGTVLTVTGHAGVAFGMDITTTANHATAIGSALGFVSVNRSCGRTHTVTNSNALPLDLTYAVQGTSETGPLHVEAQSSAKLETDAKGRILVYSQGRLVYTADVPPGC